MKEFKNRYSISADELEHRMNLQLKYHDQPLEKAIMVLEEAIDKVLTKLGVDVTKDPEDIRLQQHLLGIEINELADYPGMFVSTTMPEPRPYAWISDAVMNSDGSYHYDIQWFREERLSKVGEVKIV